MREHTKKPEDKSRTSESSDPATRQPSRDVLLRHYEERYIRPFTGNGGAIQAAGIAESVQREAKPNKTGLPGDLKSGIENISGYSLDDVRVHYNSAKPSQLQAYAYAQGAEIHIAPGQEKHLPHEAWHIVQQKQGRVRPTVQFQGVAINDDDALESEADRMGKQALRMQAGPHNFLRGSNLVGINVNQKVVQGGFYEKVGEDEVWHDENVDENFYKYIGTKRWMLFWKYPLYVNRILDLTPMSNIETNQIANNAKSTGVIKEDDITILQTTKSVYDDLEPDQQISFKDCINEVRQYCNEDGITAIIEGALKNVKYGSIIKDNQVLSEQSVVLGKKLFINRLKLMTQYVSEVGEKEINGQKIRRKYFIESTGSDPHADGRHASFLIDRNQPSNRLLYKPHSLQFENAFMGKGGFLESLNAGLPILNAGLPVMDIHPESHTEEFIERKGHKDDPIEESKFNEYMKKLGMLETASSIFGITDLHCENIIFGKDGPVAIDAECGGAFHAGTGIEDGVNPVEVEEETLANPSALYVIGKGQKTVRGAEYENGKKHMALIIKTKQSDLMEKFEELLNNIDRFRILPISTSDFAYALQDYILDGDFKEIEKFESKFSSYIDKHPVFKGQVEYEWDEVYKGCVNAMQQGTLPAFEFDLKTQAILLDNSPVGHIKPGVDIKKLMLQQMEKRINGLPVI
ncbi:MAG: DUF4135 domain-containing protein [Alistipes sp.]|nr:DUF4135 domain-containing protein [Alistipes sp.]